MLIWLCYNMFLYVMIYVCFGAYSCLNSKPQHFYVFGAYSCLASKPRYSLRLIVASLANPNVYHVHGLELWYMFMFDVFSRFSLLGIRLIPLFYMCRKIVIASGRFLAAWDCVLRKNGFGGLREWFEDEVVFSHFNYIFHVFSAPDFVMNLFKI